MGRRIIETQLEASRASGTVDGYFAKISKYIPSEILGAWIAIQGIFSKPDNPSNKYGLWAIFIFLVILAFFYIKKATDKPNVKPAIKQILFSCAAFIIWAIAIGGHPFTSLSFYDSAYGSVLMILYTLVIPLFPLNEDLPNNS